MDKNFKNHRESDRIKGTEIDLQHGSICINKALDSKTNTIKSPKTKSGNRTVFISTNLVQYLAAAQCDSLYVLNPVRGGLMTSTALRRMWYGYISKLQKANDAKPMHELFVPFTAHQLRHTYASLLYMSGADVLTAKEQLGHADIKTTLEIYPSRQKV